MDIWLRDIKEWIEYHRLEDTTLLWLEDSRGVPKAVSGITVWPDTRTIVLSAVDEAAVVGHHTTGSLLDFLERSRFDVDDDWKIHGVMEEGSNAAPFTEMAFLDEGWDEDGFCLFFDVFGE